MTRMLFVPLALFLASCASASAEPASLHDDDRGLDATPSIAVEDDAVPGSDDPDFVDPTVAHASVVAAQLDADAMLADVRAAHADEAALVLRERSDR